MRWKRSGNLCKFLVNFCKALSDRRALVTNRVFALVYKAATWEFLLYQADPFSRGFSFSTLDAQA
jgi:hypothetical protein